MFDRGSKQGVDNSHSPGAQHDSISRGFLVAGQSACADGTKLMGSLQESTHCFYSRYGQHGDVVVLPEPLRCLGDHLCGLHG